MPKSLARLIALLLVPCLAAGPSADAFASVFSASPVHLKPQINRAPFEEQALAQDMQMAIKVIFGHRARGYHELEIPVLAMQESNRFARIVDDHLRAMAVTRGMIHKILADPSLGSLFDWNLAWKRQIKDLEFLIRLIPFGENDWLPELAGLILQRVADNPDLRPEYLPDRIFGGRTLLLEKLLVLLEEEFKVYRAKLRHRRILDAEKLFFFLKNEGPLPDPLRTRPNPQDQEFFMNDFFNELLLGMLGALIWFSPEEIKLPELQPVILQAMVDGARRLHAKHDHTVLFSLLYGNLPIAMQPPAQPKRRITIDRAALCQRVQTLLDGSYEIEDIAGPHAASRRALRRLMQDGTATSYMAKKFLLKVQELEEQREVVEHARTPAESHEAVEPPPAQEEKHQAPASSPPSIKMLLNQGYSLRRAGQLQDAADTYRQVLAREPEFISARNTLAQVELEQGHADEAIRLLQETLPILDRLRAQGRADLADRHGRYTFNILATALLRAGRANEAIQLLTQDGKTLKSFLDVDPVIHATLTYACLRAGNVFQSIAIAREAFKRFPGHAGVNRALGQALRARQKLFDRQRRLMAEARSLRGQDRLAEAIGRYREVISLAPDDLQSRNAIGQLELRQGRVDAAIQLLQETLLLEDQLRAQGRSDYADRQACHTLTFLANALYRAGRPEEAVKVLTEADGKTPKTVIQQNPVAHWVLAKVLIQAQQAEEALAALTVGDGETLKPFLNDPSSEEALVVARNAFAQERIQAGRFGEAIQVLQKTLNILERLRLEGKTKIADAQEPYALVSLANAFTKSGQAGHAIEVLTEKDGQTLKPVLAHEPFAHSILAHAWTLRKGPEAVIKLLAKEDRTSLKEVFKEDTRTFHQLIIARNTLTRAELERGHLDEALRIGNETLALIDRLRTEVKEPAPEALDRYAAYTLTILAKAWIRSDRHEKAVALLTEADGTTLKPLFHNHPSALVTLANAFIHGGRARDAIKALTEDNRQLKPFLRSNPYACTTLAHAFLHMQDGDEVVKVLTEEGGAALKELLRGNVVAEHLLSKASLLRGGPGQAAELADAADKETRFSTKDLRDLEDYFLGLEEPQPPPAAAPSAKKDPGGSTVSFLGTGAVWPMVLSLVGRLKRNWQTLREWWLHHRYPIVVSPTPGGSVVAYPDGSVEERDRANNVLSARVPWAGGALRVVRRRVTGSYELWDGDRRIDDPRAHEEGTGFSWIETWGPLPNGLRGPLILEGGRMILLPNFEQRGAVAMTLREAVRLGGAVAAGLAAALALHSLTGWRTMAIGVGAQVLVIAGLAFHRAAERSAYGPFARAKILLVAA